MEGKRISQLTPDTSPSTDDYIVTVDGATTQNKRVELGSLPVSNPTNALLNGKVSKAGDTMTGNLSIIKDAPILTLNGASGTTNSTLSMIGGGAGGTMWNFVSALTGNFAFSSPSSDNALLIESTGTSGGIRIMSDRTRLRGIDYINGTGFPNGVVSAPVGSTYIDTNTTNGAIEWKKATGTGPTGWVVSVGDTGWRNIASTLINGWTVSQLRIRRVGNEVNILIEGLSAASSTNANFIPIPSGFGASIITSGRQLLHTAATPAVAYRTATQFGNITVSGATTSTPTLYGGNLYLTDDAWPVTLPGSSV